MSLRRRRIQVGLLLGAIIVLVILGMAGVFVRPVLEPNQIIAARFGDVSWNHDQHARDKDIANCQVCHHQERPGTAKPRPCRKCHKPLSNQDAVVLADLHLKQKPKAPKYEGEKGPPPMTAFHGRCVGCHRAMKEGPVVCRDCHAQSFTGAHGVVRWDHLAHARHLDMKPKAGETACQRCHHHDTKVQTDADYRPCRACHKRAATIGLPEATGIKKHEKLKHGDCRRCHSLFNPEDDRRTCKDCHAGWVVNYEKTKKRPTLEQAIHARCLECHNGDYAELTDAMPRRCDDCHSPDPSVIASLQVGLILWNHDRHANYGEGITCEKCHHADAPGQPHSDCDRCHGTGLYKNPPVAEALRKRCLGCHTEKKNGLLTWAHIQTQRKQVDRYEWRGPEGTFWWGHREHAVSWSFSCRNCHHGTLRKDGVYVSAAKAQKAWTGDATHIQSCRKCHGPTGPVADSPAAGTKAPKLADAFAKVCLECHRRLGGGPQQWADFFKVEPVGDEKAAAVPTPQQEL